MPNFTKNGVCYPIEESPFTAHRNGFTFFFSSMAHLTKFNDKVRERELWLNDSLSRRFKCFVDADILADIQLYEQIEKRGYYVEHESGESWRYGGMQIRCVCSPTRSEPTTEPLIG